MSQSLTNNPAPLTYQELNGRKEREKNAQCVKINKSAKSCSTVFIAAIFDGRSTSEIDAKLNLT